MTLDKRKSLFEKHVPLAAVEYCYSLWKELNFDLRITRSRSSKLGDYRYDPASQKHSISVNHDLSKYSFLITYIHEVAHKINFDLHKNTVDPHGKEWKLQFKKLMIPMLTEKIFPMEILSPLALHMKNPKASSVRDSALYEALYKNDSNTTSHTLLKDINIGQRFLFKKKIYKKIELKRTRVLCELIDSGRHYLISETAPVSGFKH